MDWNELRQIQKEINMNPYIQGCFEGTPIPAGAWVGIQNSLERLVYWLEEHRSEWRGECGLSDQTIKFLETKLSQVVNNLYTMLPLSFLDNGFKALTHLEWKVFTALLRFANVKTLQTFVSNKKVAALAGVSVKHIHESIGGLRKKGLVQNLGKHSSGTYVRQLSFSPIDLGVDQGVDDE